MIAKFSEDWDIERLSKMDLAVMRLSAYEILFSDKDSSNKVPVCASINEAVELAKAFGTDESVAFVNGILGRIAAVAEGQNPADDSLPDSSRSGLPSGEKTPARYRRSNYVKRG